MAKAVWARDAWRLSRSEERRRWRRVSAVAARILESEGTGFRALDGGVDGGWGTAI